MSQATTKAKPTAEEQRIEADRKAYAEAITKTRERQKAYENACVEKEDGFDEYVDAVLRSMPLQIPTGETIPGSEAPEMTSQRCHADPSFHKMCRGLIIDLCQDQVRAFVGRARQLGYPPLTRESLALKASR